MGPVDEFQARLNRTIAELSDSISTGYMSDSKSMVYGLMTLAPHLPLPVLLLADVIKHTEEAWSCATGDGDVYQRAGSAVGELGVVARLLEGQK